MAGLIVGACSTSLEAPQPQIIIASEFPLTPGAMSVPSMQDAIRLAVTQNPKLGNYRVGYVPYDDALGGQAWPEKGLANLNSMLTDPRVLGMVGTFNSYTTLEEIPRASEENFVMVSPSATQVCFTVAPLCDAQIESAHASYPINFFRIAPPDPVQGRAIAIYAAQLHITRVAAINMWHPPAVSDGDPYIAEFKHELSLRGGQVVLTQEVPYPTVDFTDFLARAKQAGAEAIYAVGDVAGGICDIRSQMGSNFTYLLLTDGATEDDDCLKAPASVATFGTYGDVDAALSPDPTVKKIVHQFQDAYPGVKVLDYTFAAYDCAMILIRAIERAIAANGGSVPNRLDVLRQVATGEFDGGATGNYKFLPSGDAVSPMMTIWGVRNNHWYFIDRLDASAAS